MKQVKSDELIRITAKRLFAKFGYDGISMRILSKESGVGLSSIYHFFKDKDILLKTIYEETNRSLGASRSRLSSSETAKKMLEQLIYFQFKHMEDVVYVLKYYLAFREDFALLPSRTLPAKSVLHVEEVIQKGIQTGEFAVGHDEIVTKAKVIAHTINGYLLEYYPHVPKGKELHGITDDIVSFSMAGLSH